MIAVQAVYDPPPSVTDAAEYLDDQAGTTGHAHTTEHGEPARAYFFATAAGAEACAARLRASAYVTGVHLHPVTAIAAVGPAVPLAS